MSNVVQFLEALARNPNLSADDYVASVAATDFDPDTKAALMGRDVRAINQAVGNVATVMAFLIPADNEEQDGDGQRGDEDQGGDEQPSREVGVKAA